MQRVPAQRPSARFEAFAADVADTLFRAGCLMTGDAGEAEDLVQETFVRVARRWHRVAAAMDHPAAARCATWSSAPNSCPTQP
jgi:DNA-directed RNA polymerase specialized sigma24 family protein